jgi:hypothetical protein
LLGQLKREIRGKAIGIAFDGLVESRSRYPIQACEFGVQQDALATNNLDCLLDLFGSNRNGSRMFRHARSLSVRGSKAMEFAILRQEADAHPCAAIRRF